MTLNEQKTPTHKHYQQRLWYEFHCPECEYIWESDQRDSVREWCPCGTVIEPELIYYPWWDIQLAGNNE